MLLAVTYIMLNNYYMILYANDKNYSDITMSCHNLKLFYLSLRVEIVGLWYVNLVFVLSMLSCLNQKLQYDIIYL